MRPYALVLFAVSIAPLPLAAQSLGVGPNTTSDFSISASPQYPLPQSTATVSFLSSSLDLTNATIRVSVNGKELYAGTVHSVSVPLGKTGSVAQVTATVSVGGADYTQTLTLEPQDVVLVAEPIASAPALYPGKPGVPFEGDVRVVAIANVRSASGAAVSPAALSYAWTVDGTQITNSSGIGKSAIIVASPLQYRAHEISVAVTNADGSLTGGSALSLVAQAPSVRIYENDPLLGVRYDRALSDSYSMQNVEAGFFAEPFSFPLTSGAPSIEWFLNGSPAQMGNSITLRPAGSGGGQASLSVVVSSGENTKATDNLSLSFGGGSSSNLFGL